jgi:hypothetical protein
VRPTHFLRNAGIPTYVIAACAGRCRCRERKDERIPVKSFYDGVEYQYLLVKALSSGK